MATKKHEDQSAAERASSQPILESAEVESVSADANQQNEQITELKNLVNSLALSFQASQARNAQNAAFQDAVAEIRQAARAMATASVAPVYVSSQTSTERDCQGCDCECTSPECCEFDIVLCKVRATRPQIEPPDAGDIPLVQNAMEVRIYVTANKFGTLIPSLASTLDLRADGLPPGPGPWVIIERVINRVRVKKGTTQTVDLHVEVEEDDSRLTEQVAAAGKNEYGEASGTITLNCCMPEIYPPMPLDVDLRYGGEGRGAVQLVVCARRVCC